MVEFGSQFAGTDTGNGSIERLQAHSLLHHFPCCRLTIDQAISAEAFPWCFSNHDATATNNFDSLITTNSEQPTLEVIFLPIARQCEKNLGKSLLHRIFAIL